MGIVGLIVRELVRIVTGYYPPSTEELSVTLAKLKEM